MASSVLRLWVVLAAITAGTHCSSLEGAQVAWVRRNSSASCQVPSQGGGRTPPPHLALEADGAPYRSAGPTAHWWRDGDKLAAKRVAADGSVVIKKEGTYRCGMRVGAGLVLGFETTYRFPTMENEFDVQPEEQTVLQGQPLLLRCHIPSAPEARYSWLKNGNLLPSDTRYHTLVQGQLLITNVAREDIGNYSCEATNQYLNKVRRSRSARVSVLPPAGSRVAFLDVQGYDGQLFVDKGASLLLPCPVLGRPRPVVSWDFNNGSIVQNDVIRTEVFRIEAAEVADSGEYSCWLPQTPGLRKSFNVSVREGPVIVAGPQGKQAARGASTVRFNCTSSGHPRPSVLWYKDGQLLNITERFKVVPSKSELIISMVTSNDSGIYQCFATAAGGGVASAWASLTVLSGAPAPTALACAPLGPYAVRVRWAPPPRRALYKAYSVHAIAPDGTIEAARIPQPEPSALTEDLPLKLPFTPYKVYVLGYSTSFATEPSLRVVCSGQGAPVSVKQVEEGVRVSWPRYEGAGVSQWRLQHRAANSTEVQEETLPGNQTDYTLPAGDYEVRVLGSISGEWLQEDLSLVPWTSTSNNVTAPDGASSEGAAGGGGGGGVPAPTALQLLEAGADSARLRWSCERAELSATRYKFIVCYKMADFRSHDTRATCDESYSTEALLTGLQPDSAYEVRVQAMPAAGGAGGPFSHGYLFRTLGDNSPKIEVVYSVVGDAVEVRWSTVWPRSPDPTGQPDQPDQPAQPDQTPKSDAYVVRYSQNLTLPMDQWPTINVSGANSVLLKGLDWSRSTYVMVFTQDMQRHGPVKEIPPTPAHRSLTLIGVAAGAAVCATCLLCAAIFCVWKRRRKLPRRRNDSAGFEGEESAELRVRGALLNGSGEGCDGGLSASGARGHPAEPLLNGYPHHALLPTPTQSKTPNGRQGHAQRQYAAFDVSRYEDQETTLDTILEADNSDCTLDRSTDASYNKLPDDNMNELDQVGRACAPNLQPNG